MVHQTNRIRANIGHGPIKEVPLQTGIRTRASETAGRPHTDNNNRRTRNGSIASPSSPATPEVRAIGHNSYDGDDDDHDNDNAGGSSHDGGSQGAAPARANVASHIRVLQVQQIDLGDVAVNVDDELLGRMRAPIGPCHLSCTPRKDEPREPPLPGKSHRLAAKRDVEDADLDDNAGEGSSKRHSR